MASRYTQFNSTSPSRVPGRLPSFISSTVTLATALWLMAGPAPAQSIPSPADALLRQQERESVLRAQQERTPDIRLPQPGAAMGQERLSGDETGCIDIKRITLTGEAAEQFQWALPYGHKLEDGTPDPANDRCLGKGDLNLVMRRIQNALLAKGFSLAQVLAGPQRHLAEGTIELTLFPGRIRRIEFAPGTEQKATKWNAIPVRAGEVLNLRDIEQALENFKTVPTAEADIEFRPAEGPGAEPGYSDVIIHWKQGVPFRVSLSADDSGTRATGKYQGSLTLAYDHLLTLNDVFYVSLSHDLGTSGTGAGPYGTRGYTINYAVPLGYWLLGLTASSNRYHQSVAGANQTYLYSGASKNSEIRLSRVLYRDAVRKTGALLRAWTRASENYIDDTEVEVQRRRMAGLDFGLTHRELIDTASLDANLNYRRGTGAWGSLAAPEEAFGEGTSRPQIITADARLNVPFKLGGQAFTYTGAWRGQWNKTPLIPQDRFAIGGRYTVRGFDGERQLVAERGWIVRNDVAAALGQSGHALYLGLDYGQVAGPSSALLIGKHLSGAVLGLRGAFPHFSYDLFVGKPVSKPSGFHTASSLAGFNLNWWF